MKQAADQDMPTELEALLEGEVLRTVDLMALVRRQLDSSHSYVARSAAIERLQPRTLEVLSGGEFVLPQYLLGDDDWELDSHLRLTSHRPLSGRLILFAKRLSLPFVRWIFEYSRRNFERQRRLDRALLATVEVLAVEVATLQQRLEKLQDRESRAREETGR
jgi:hypothetical protein